MPLNYKTKEDFYAERFQQWKESISLFSSHPLENVEEKKADIIAMSRKMPRLLKWIVRNDDKKVSLNSYILTEHSLPFCYEKLRGKRVKVLDDALYFGSTIDYVTQNIAWATGQEQINVFPLLMCKTYRSFRYATFEKDLPTINERDLPFFTTRHARNILSLGIPLDVEFPILQFKRRNSEPKMDIALCEDNLKKVFIGYPVYKVTHEVYNEAMRQVEQVNSFSIILEDETSHNHSDNSDFAKLRFYIGREVVRIVCYAPLAISESMLFEKSPSLFRNTSFDWFWQQAYKVATPIDQPTLDTTNQALLDYSRETYERSRQKSLVMWANYLYSFSEVMKHSSSIHQFLAMMGFDTSLYISHEDLTYLVGPWLASDFRQNLINLFNSANPLFIEPEKDSFRTISSVFYRIPSDIAEKYHESNRQIWFKCRTVSQAMSALFTNQHFCIGLANKETIDRYQKLGFGVTYNSIYSDLSLYAQFSSNLHIQIHQWMDMKIDEGCVAPKYERINVAGRYYWKRMFRSGENEDSYVKIARIGLYIFKHLEKFFQKSRISRKQVEELFAIIFCDPLHKIMWDYKFADIRCRWNDECKMWQAMLHDTISGEDFSLLDMLFIRNSYLDSIDEKITYTSELYISETERTQQLLQSTPLSNAQQRIVDAYLNLYTTTYRSEYKNLTNNFFVEELINSLQKSRTEWLEVSSRLNTFIVNFSEKITTDDKINEINSFDKILIPLFRRYCVFTPTRLDKMKENQSNNDLFKELYHYAVYKKQYKELLLFFLQVSSVLFYWELFKGIFIQENIKYVEHSIYILEKGLRKTLPVELKEICSSSSFYKDIPRKRKLAKSIIASLIYDIYNA